MLETKWTIWSQHVLQSPLDGAVALEGKQTHQSFSSLINHNYVICHLAHLSLNPYI